MSNPHELSEQGIEQAIQQAGKTAPRLTPESIDAVIEQSMYFVFPGTSVTVCCLTLRNGYHVIGQSAAVSLENFDKAIGESVAYADARDKIWQLEGYLLKDKLSKA